jgi:hypothetical protein
VFDGVRTNHSAPHSIVILSGVAVSRSEAATASKDPCTPTPGTSVSGSSPRPSTASRECLAESISQHACMGSFDCVVVRNANDNFAQDDNFLELRAGYKGRGPDRQGLRVEHSCSDERPAGC